MTNEERMFYRLHAKSPKFLNLVCKTKTFITKVLSQHYNPYCAYSTGKDSLVMLSLCLGIQPKMTIFYHDSGVELPESVKILKKAQKFYNFNLSIVNSPIDVLDLYEKKGSFGGAFLTAMLTPLRKWAQNNAKDCAFIGLRIQESKIRKKMILTYGDHFYAKTNKIWEAFPLAFWSATDIFAYIVSSNIENLLHPAYSKTRFTSSMENIRVSWYCDPTIIAQGQIVWLRFYYPKIFRALRKRFPGIIKNYS